MASAMKIIRKHFLKILSGTMCSIAFTAPACLQSTMIVQAEATASVKVSQDTGIIRKEEGKQTYTFSADIDDKKDVEGKIMFKTEFGSGFYPSSVSTGDWGDYSSGVTVEVYSGSDQILKEDSSPNSTVSLSGDKAVTEIVFTSKEAPVKTDKLSGIKVSGKIHLNDTDDYLNVKGSLYGAENKGTEEAPSAGDIKKLSSHNINTLCRYSTPKKPEISVSKSSLEENDETSVSVNGMGAYGNTVADKVDVTVNIPSRTEIQGIEAPTFDNASVEILIDKKEQEMNGRTVSFKGNANTVLIRIKPTGTVFTQTEAMKISLKNTSKTNGEETIKAVSKAVFMGDQNYAVSSNGSTLTFSAKAEHEEPEKDPGTDNPGGGSGNSDTKPGSGGGNNGGSNSGSSSGNSSGNHSGSGSGINGGSGNNSGSSSSGGSNSGSGTNQGNKSSADTNKGTAEKNPTKKAETTKMTIVDKTGVSMKSKNTSGKSTSTYSVRKKATTTATRPTSSTSTRSSTSTSSNTSSSSTQRTQVTAPTVDDQEDSTGTIVAVNEDVQSDDNSSNDFDEDVSNDIEQDIDTEKEAEDKSVKNKVKNNRFAQIGIAAGAVLLISAAGTYFLIRTPKKKDGDPENPESDGENSENPSEENENKESTEPNTDNEPQDEKTIEE